MSKNDAIVVMNNSDLNDNKERNRAKDYFKNDKELLRGRAKDKYRELSEEEKKYKMRVWKKKILQRV